MRPLHQLRFELFADYFQFYLWDPTTDPKAPTDWSARLKVSPGSYRLRAMDGGLDSLSQPKTSYDAMKRSALIADVRARAWDRR
jgi:hypothetical protein